jgi:hypothetical protein
MENFSSFSSTSQSSVFDEQRERADLHAAERPEDEGIVEQRRREHGEGHPGRVRQAPRDLRDDEAVRQQNADAREHDEERDLGLGQAELVRRPLIHSTQSRFVKPSIGSSPTFHTRPWPSARLRA